MEEFDFVIVGAGTAGCALAYRLGERGHSVCVLEAGPPDTSPLIRIPSGIMKTSHNPRITWRYELQGNENINGRNLSTYYGKMLGGSSSINGMVYNRGQSSDFDNWADAGNPGWDYASVLPYFRKSETYTTGGDDQYRGRLGPVRTGVLNYKDKISELLLRGSVETGVPLNPDYNGAAQEGVGYVQAAIHKGTRWSSARAYLHPARKRFGVDVRPNMLVRRVLVADGRATGVEYSPAGSGEVRTMHARISTIVSAGATFSPKLLQLSGIGPAELLQRFNIPVLRELGGVGENLSDHYSARVEAQVRPGFGTVNERVKPLRLAGEVLAWLLGRPSVLALTSRTVIGFCKMDPAAASTDYSIMFLPAALKSGKTREFADRPGVTGSAWCNRPQSRGYVRIRSADIEDAPIIYPNYLDTESDRQMMVFAVKHLHRVFRSEAMRPLVEKIIAPELECRSDDEWLDHIRATGNSSFHSAGTCKMGPQSDPSAVVDPRLRVHGVAGLRVIDASIMPAQVSGNTNAAVMMIAEKAADMILEDIK